VAVCAREEHLVAGGAGAAGPVHYPGTRPISHFHSGRRHRLYRRCNSRRHSHPQKQRHKRDADANVTSKDKLAFAIYYVPQGNTDYNGGSRAYNLFNHAQINDAFSLIWNRILSPTFLNEARANAAGWRWNEILDNPQQPVGLPQDNILAIGSITLNQFGSSLGSILNQWTYGYKDVATKIIHQHTIKFGADFTNLHYLNDPIGRPNYSFYNVWDFLNDAPESESGSFNTVTGFPGGTRQDFRQNLFGAFAQDDWKVTPNLTLHAGLRYSYFGPLYTKQNNLSTAETGPAGTDGMRRPVQALWEYGFRMNFTAGGNSDEDSQTKERRTTTHDWLGPRG
jgi:hypothetical protein